MKNKTKKIRSKKSWTIELIEFEDNTTQLTRTNEGFNALELLGLANKATHEILYQISKEMKPTKSAKVIVKKQK